jgi:hypothetical protein
MEIQHKHRVSNLPERLGACVRKTQKLGSTALA